MSDINYSAELLHRDKLERSNIIQLLYRIKRDYEITGLRVAEFGCGLGQNLQVFATDNQVLGIEGVDEAVAIARSLGLNVIVGDLEQALPLEDCSVDWVLCLDVLEHLFKPKSLMHEIERVLAPSGRAIVNVPNHFVLSGRIRLFLGSGLDTCDFFPGHKEWDNPHLRFFTRTGYLELIKATGFSVVSDFSHEFPAVPFNRLLSRMGLSVLGRSAARRWPSLFAGGQFVIIEKVC